MSGQFSILIISTDVRARVCVVCKHSMHEVLRKKLPECGGEDAARETAQRPHMATSLQDHIYKFI